MAAAFSSTSVAAPVSTSTASSFLVGGSNKKLTISIRKKKQQQVVNKYQPQSGRGLIVRAMAVNKEVDETKQTEQDRWRGLAYDTSDDQQDITRGKGMIDSLFQAPMGDGTHVAVLSSYDYVSQGLRQYSFDNTMDGYYIAPAFMDKLVVHIAKNFMTLPNIKVRMHACNPIPACIYTLLYMHACAYIYTHTSFFV